MHHGVHGLHSLDGHAVVVHHITYALPESLPASSVIVWPTVDGCFVPHLTNDQQVPEQLLRSLSGIAPATVIPAVLRPHCASCSRGA